jgi:hypothetical protein
MKSRSRAMVAFVGVAVAGLLAGAAFAYFLGSGSGNGSATVGMAQTVTVEAVASGSPSSTLLPGGTADLLVQLQNSASTAVTIVAISQNGPATPVGGNGCTASNDSVTVPSRTGLSISVATGTQLVHFAGAAAMASSSASGCQGAAFDIPVTLTVQQP